MEVKCTDSNLQKLVHPLITGCRCSSASVKSLMYAAKQTLYTASSAWHSPFHVQNYSLHHSECGSPCRRGSTIWVPHIYPHQMRLLLCSSSEIQAISHVKGTVMTDAFWQICKLLFFLKYTHQFSGWVWCVFNTRVYFWPSTYSVPTWDISNVRYYSAQSLTTGAMQPTINYTIPLQ